MSRMETGVRKAMVGRGKWYLQVGAKYEDDPCRSRMLYTVWSMWASGSLATLGFEAFPRGI